MRSVAFAVEDEIEDVVMIAANEAGVVELKEEIDNAFGIRAAIDVVTGENKFGVGVLSLHHLNERGERFEHAVDVADDPAHESILKWLWEKSSHEERGGGDGLIGEIGTG